METVKMNYCLVQTTITSHKSHLTLPHSELWSKWLYNLTWDSYSNLNVEQLHDRLVSNIFLAAIAIISNHLSILLELFIKETISLLIIYATVVNVTSLYITRIILNSGTIVAPVLPPCNFVHLKLYRYIQGGRQYFITIYEE